MIDPIAYHFARMQPCNFETSATSSMNLTGVSTRADGDGICSARPEELYSCGVGVPPWLVGKTRRDVFENGFQWISGCVSQDGSKIVIGYDIGLLQEARPGSGWART